MLLGSVASLLLPMLALCGWLLWLLLRNHAKAQRALSAERASHEAQRAAWQAEAAARDMRLQTLADLSPQILWQADAQGRVTYLNRAWHAMAGEREDGWLGWGWLNALHPDDCEPMHEAFTAAREAKEPLRLRRRFRTRDGDYRSFLAVAAPVITADGSVECWVGVDTDITPLERHEGRLKELDDDLDSFSYTLSHELRTPVQVIRGFVDAVLSGEAGTVDDDARRYLDRVRRNAARMDELMTDMVALSRLSRETLRCERFDPLALARRTATLVQQRHGDRVVECLASGGVDVVADKRLFQILLEQLVDNAVKFSPGDAVCRIEVQARHERDEVVIEVGDRGIGFPDEMAERLFRPFQRLHASDRFAGAGMGLATAARIVRLHGGTIEGRNRPGGGAAFEIRMPQLPVTGVQADMTEER